MTNDNVKKAYETIETLEDRVSALEVKSAMYESSISLLARNIPKVPTQTEDKSWFDIRACTHPVVKTLHAEKTFEIRWCCVCGAHGTQGHKMFDTDAVDCEWRAPTFERPYK